MYVNRCLGLLAVIAALSGCGTDTDQRRLIEQSAMEPTISVDELDAQRYALEGFWNRLDAARTFHENGNRFLFVSTRDSLVSDVNSYIREYPDAEQDADFERLLNRLTTLDTLGVASGTSLYATTEDSLALSFAAWPEGVVEPDDGRLFSTLESEFPLIDHPRIDFWIQYFTGPGRERFERSVYRMELHRPAVESILEELGLPPEMICVALIESGFTMNARSYASAVGPWQFMRATGKLYGLRSNWWYDERRDLVASTYAAGHYLRDLYGIWDDWYLALAAYNCGEYRVARETGRQRTKNFWSLDLPRQTERYVPKFLAALYILREPEKYDMEIPVVSPEGFDLVTIPDATDLKVIAECAETTVNVIKELNPQCLRWATPPGMEVVLRVPRGKGDTCAANLAGIPPEERITWRRHTIKRGETLSQIASHYGTTVTALKELNNIHNSHKIREGHSLVVPLKGGDFVEMASASKPTYMNPSRSIDKNAMEKYSQRQQPPKGYKRLTYTVKSRDTLGEIAEQYRTSASKLRAWNNLSYRRYIYPGQKLAIYVPVSFSPPDQPVTKVVLPDESQYSRYEHVVQKGENLYSISRTYQVALGELLAWNNKSQRSVIHPGDVLVVWRKK